MLGSGGFGVVVAAKHIHLNDRVALKFLLPEALNNPEIVERFLREARSAVKIKSEHVARVLDIGTLPNGAPYMVMEYLSGRDMSDEIARRGPLPPEEAIEVLLQACEAIAEAHELGIIHRDLKPANLFRTERPGGSFHIKVLDFGIAKSAEGELSAAQKGLTATSAVMGSPLYMSPEQMRSTRSTDARSDIWSLGVILFQMLAGRVPFDADSMPGIVAMVFTDEVPSFAQLGVGVAPGLEGVVRRCLEKSPEKRYQSVRELAEALLPYCAPASRLSITHITATQRPIIPEPGKAGAPPGAFDQTHQALSSTLPTATTRRAALGSGLALALVLGLIGLAWRLTGHAGAPDEASGRAAGSSLAAPLASAAGSAAASVAVVAVAPAAPEASAPPAADGRERGSAHGAPRNPDSSRTTPVGPRVDHTVDSRH